MKGTLSAPVPFAGIDAEIPSRKAGFHDAWMKDLMAHYGEWRHPREVAPNALSAELAKLAGKAKATAERHGFTIESGPQGYRLLDYHMPRLRPGPEPGEHHVDDVDDGQLRFEEAV